MSVSALKGNQRGEHHTDRTIVWLLAPAMTILLVMVIYPLIYSFYASTQSLQLMRPQDAHFVGLGNYIHAFQDGDLRVSFVNTVVFVASSLLLEFGLGLGLALLFNRRFPGESVIRTLLIVPMMCTPVAVGLMWRWLYNPDIGLINYLVQILHLGGPRIWLGDYRTAMPSVIAVEVWQWTPFVFLCLLAGLRSLPEEPLESARIDGASGWKIFRYVMLPQLKPIILVVLLFRTVDVLRTFDLVYVLTGGAPGLSTEVLSLTIYKLAFKYFSTGYSSAVSWLFLIFVMVICSQLIRLLQREDVI